MARFAGRMQTPDSDGDFGYGANDGEHVEIISFNKPVDDAKKCNPCFSGSSTSDHERGPSGHRGFD